MTILMATYAEAAPLVRALPFRQISKKPFHIFQYESIRLVITGIGPINAAAATGYIVSHPQPLLNIGICAGKERGALYNVYKAIDDATGKSYLLERSPLLPNAKLRTFHKPLSTPIRELADMEGAAIAAIGKRAGCEVRILKIVSDAFDPGSVTPQLARKLVQSRLQEILDIIYPHQSPR